MRDSDIVTDGYPIHWACITSSASTPCSLTWADARCEVEFVFVACTREYPTRAPFHKMKAPFSIQINTGIMVGAIRG